MLEGQVSERDDHKLLYVEGDSDREVQRKNDLQCAAGTLGVLILAEKTRRVLGTARISGVGVTAPHVCMRAHVLRERAARVRVYRLLSLVPE
jgi:hypothetical protein